MEENSNANGVSEEYSYNEEMVNEVPTDQNGADLQENEFYDNQEEKDHDPTNQCDSTTEYSSTFYNENDNGEEQTSHDNMFDPPCSNDVLNSSDLLTKLCQNSQDIILQYLQPLKESEDFEDQVSDAISDLKAHAKILDDMIDGQKEVLCGQLNTITQKLSIKT